VQQTTGIVFPHQLIEDSPLISTCSTIYLIEEYLFFKQYKFHKQKIAFHRASMKCYQTFLESKGIQVEYIESINILSDIRNLIPHLKSKNITQFAYIDTTDNWLEKRIQETSIALSLTYIKYNSPLFINSTDEIQHYYQNKKRLFQADFYKQQRIKKSILIDNQSNPIGGKWSFDEDNRLKYPKGKTPPTIKSLELNPYYEEAISYTKKHFPNNYGELNTQFIYPIDFSSSKLWLQQFLEVRFKEFGKYEDAIVQNENHLHHSVLTPMLNVGLLNPRYIIDEAISFSQTHEIPLNSLEGFIRQILGWREYIRMVYEWKGSYERTRNFWGFKRKIPANFWTGETGIPPIDITIKKILETGYCHHIERLMILGNFMVLCEFDPDEVYTWFMELFIDSYDWVMVPNVYGMSQFADGGIMSTKPYISGSNYLLKMSDFEKGEWQLIWDGLFWRFMHEHRDFFLKNPRLSMLIKSFDKMSDEKKQSHLLNANHYLNSLTFN